MASSALTGRSQVFDNNNDDDELLKLDARISKVRGMELGQAEAGAALKM